MTDLSRKRERDRLALRADPYWHRLARGSYLGFRRGPDTWIARYRGRDGKQLYQPLGEHLDYDHAKRRAEDWLSQLAGSPVRRIRRGTVRAALTAYVEDLRRHRRPEAAAEAEWRFKAVVDTDRIPQTGQGLGDLELESITQDDFLEWRDRISEGRQPRTVNRYVRAVVAGLNRARELGHIGNPLAWKLTRLADDLEDEGGNPTFLTEPQRRSLIPRAKSAADFLRGLELTGARPKELANAIVSDFKGDSLRLAHRKGRPPRLRVRHVVLSQDGVTFFETLARDRDGSEPLFTMDGEQPWRRDKWAMAVRGAIAGHNAEANERNRIPETASAYSFRHARISELLQIHGIDPLTVAAQTGTSLAVIERTYFRFIPSAMRAKLAAVKDSN